MAAARTVVKPIPATAQGGGRVWRQRVQNATRNHRRQWLAHTRRAHDEQVVAAVPPQSQQYMTPPYVGSGRRADGMATACRRIRHRA
jgi:hypothetical protein